MLADGLQCTLVMNPLHLLAFHLLLSVILPEVHDFLHGSSFVSLSTILSFEKGFVSPFISPVLYMVLFLQTVDILLTYLYFNDERSLMMNLFLHLLERLLKQLFFSVAREIVFILLLCFSLRTILTHNCRMASKLEI